jgi:hypothetical protein
VRERQAQLLRARGGRRDDDLDVSVTDQAGTAFRPLRVQCGQALALDSVLTAASVRQPPPPLQRVTGPGERIWSAHYPRITGMEPAFRSGISQSACRCIGKISR